MEYFFSLRSYLGRFHGTFCALILCDFLLLAVSLGLIRGSTGVLMRFLLDWEGTRRVLAGRTFIQLSHLLSPYCKGFRGRVNCKWRFHLLPFSPELGNSPFGIRISDS